MRSIRIQTVLLIEDNQALREAYTEVLSDFGYNVLPAADAARGLDLWRRYQPDLVVTDWLIPDLDHTGEMFLREWVQAADRCPVLVCCGTAEYASYAERVYGTPYLIKPFGLDMFERAVEVLLQVVQEVA